jgi:hypothetical protein
MAAERVRKQIIVEKCDDCPYNGGCAAWKKLTGKQRVTLAIGVGVGDFILKDCHLEDELLGKRAKVAQVLATVLSMAEADPAALEHFRPQLEKLLKILDEV